jgi:hypothetical protein
MPFDAHAAVLAENKNISRHKFYVILVRVLVMQAAAPVLSGIF